MLTTRVFLLDDCNNSQGRSVSDSETQKQNSKEIKEAKPRLFYQAVGSNVEVAVWSTVQ